MRLDFDDAGSSSTEANPIRFTIHGSKLTNQTTMAMGLNPSAPASTADSEAGD